MFRNLRAFCFVDVVGIKFTATPRELRAVAICCYFWQDCQLSLPSMRRRLAIPTPLLDKEHLLPIVSSINHTYSVMHSPPPPTHKHTMCASYIPTPSPPLLHLHHTHTKQNGAKSWMYNVYSCTHYSSLLVSSFHMATTGWCWFLSRLTTRPQ